MPRRTSPIYCEHANEMPSRCPCDDDCYCKDHSCKIRSIPVSIGMWFRQDDGTRYRVATFSPQLLTLFDNSFNPVYVTPRMLGYERLEKASTAGLDFSPFRFHSPSWMSLDMGKLENRNLLCNVSTCGQPATEGWSFTAKVRGRTEQKTWMLCGQHWFFPDNWEDFLLPPEEQPDWISEQGRRLLGSLIVQESQRLKEIALASEKADKESEPLTVYDEFLLGDF